MSGNYKVISDSYGVGTNSTRILIEEGNLKKLLKITDLYEKHVESPYTPKIYSINSEKYKKLKPQEVLYVYEYEFIDGFLLSECAIDDEIFTGIIQMLEYFFSNGYFVWDCHLDNIVVKNKKPYFVDFDGISKQPFNETVFIPEYLSTDCPEEFLKGDPPLSYNTEAFVIYRIADQIIKRCKLLISGRIERVLNKMHAKQIIERYASFNEVLKKIN